jgi:ATP phosphoribosyltransferase regulatory subunit
MSKEKKFSSDNKILPVGFYDLVFEEAETNHSKINIAVNYFLNLGFRLFKAPLVEFESNFDDKNAKNSFKLVDNISGRNMLLRQDITPQIARLIQTRFKDEKFPIKLCYVGDVLVAKNNDFYQDRQQTQVGIESIGENSEDEKLQIVAITLDVIEKLGVKNLLIEFYLPDFCQIFLTENNLENNQKLLSAIYQKNISEIRANISDRRICDVLENIVLNNQNLMQISQDIAKITNSKKIREELEKSEKIFHFLSEKFPEVKICFDLFGDNQKSYHQNFSFDIFSSNFPYPIAKGGCYKILIKEEDQSKTHLDAIGSTIYMNFLRKIF